MRRNVSAAVFLFWLIGVATHLSAGSPNSSTEPAADPIQEKLDDAKAVCRTKITAGHAELITAIEKMMATAKSNGNLKRYAYLKMVCELTSEELSVTDEVNHDDGLYDLNLVFCKEVMDAKSRLDTAYRWRIAGYRDSKKPDDEKRVMLDAGANDWFDFCDRQKDEPRLSGAVDLLSKVNSARNGTVGTWTVQGSSLRGTNKNGSRITLGNSLPKSFDCIVDFIRIEGSGYIGVYGNADLSFMYGIGLGNNTLAGFQLVDGKGIDFNPTAKKEEIYVSNGLKRRMILSVRPDHLRCSLGSQGNFMDGRYVTEWDPGMGSVSLPADQKLPANVALAVGAGGDTDVVFTTIRLLPR